MFYLFGFELKSTGSVQGEFKILDLDCCCGVSISVKLSDSLRLGSATRIPGRSPIFPDVELLPDNDNPCIPLFNTVDLEWTWEETIRLDIPGA
jgi:hypothetical protein